MKRNWIILLGVAMALLMGCATAQERAEQREQMKAAVAEALANRHLHIDITSMTTLRYGTKTVTSSDFFLELRGDTLRSDLPYWGQAYQASIGSPSIGLNFEAPIRRFSESRPKANKTQIDLEVMTREDTYYYFIEVYDSGESLIRVRSMNRDPISFDGRVGEMTE